MADRSVSARWRALSLVLVGLVAGTLLLTPAGAHIGTPNHLWKKHLKAKVNTLLNKPTLISVPCGDWALATGSASITRERNACFLSGAGDNLLFLLPVPIPAALQGNRAKVTGVEICYHAAEQPGAVLDAVFADVITNAHDPGGPLNMILLDDSDRTDVACRLHTMNITLTPNDVLQFVIRVDFSGPSSLVIGRTTIMIKRTGTAAPPLS